MQNCCFSSEISSPNGVFFGENFVTPFSTLANNNQQVILLYKVKAENFKPKLRFFVFPAKVLLRFSHTVLDLRKHQAVLPD